MPPSRKRPAYQPVVEIALAISKGFSKPVNITAVNKIKDTPELKDVFDYQERLKLLQGAFEVDRDAVRDKRILLVDDLYRSGATAAVVAQDLVASGAEKGFTILVGEANGADKAVQRHLAEKGYRNVLVHCMTTNCRNNLADWPMRDAGPICHHSRRFVWRVLNEQDPASTKSSYAHYSPLHPIWGPRHVHPLYALAGKLGLALAFVNASPGAV